MPAALRGLIGCASVLVGDADDADIVAVNLTKRSVSFYYSRDFAAALCLFHRKTTVYLRNQHVRDQIFDDDRRLLFLDRSRYEKDPVGRKRRTDLENRIRSVVKSLEQTSLTVTYSEVTAALKQRQS